MLVFRVLERFAFYGVSANLLNYMTTQLHKDVVSSITSVNNWSGLSWITPLLGAYLADSYMGRFWTITLSLLIYAIVSCSFLFLFCLQAICLFVINYHSCFFFSLLLVINFNSDNLHRVLCFWSSQLH